MLDSEYEIMKLLMGIEIDSEPGTITTKDGRALYAPMASIKYYDYIRPRYGEDFLRDLIKKYGILLSHLKITWDDEKATKEDVLESLEEQIHIRLKNWQGKYDDKSMPEEFKAKFPDLFLSDDAPQELKDAYYGGTLTFDMIKENPKYVDFLKGKPLYGRILDIDFSKGENTLIDPNSKKDGYKSHLFAAGLAHVQQSLRNRVDDEHRWLTDDEILDLAPEFGNYLYAVDPPVYKTGDYIHSYDSTIPHHDTWSFEQKVQFIRDNLEEAILKHEIPYLNDNVPAYFKKKHPELFVADDAPEDLKEWFFGMEFPSNRSFSCIASHPEWREYLKGKDLQFAINKFRTKRFFEIFDSETALKLIYRYSEIIDKMVALNRTNNGSRLDHVEATNRIKTWYDATREKVYSS